MSGGDVVVCVLSTSGHQVLFPAMSAGDLTSWVLLLPLRDAAGGSVGGRGYADVDATDERYGRFAEGKMALSSTLPSQTLATPVCVLGGLTRSAGTPRTSWCC